ncbi:MAG: hypothetical protein AAGH83_01100 [Pseudomonadota bacterium]
MLGYKIARHSVTLILRNHDPFIQIIWPAFFATMWLNYLMTAYGFIPTWSGGFTQSDYTPNAVAAHWQILLAFLVLSVGCTVWSVTAWHRFVLLEDQPVSFHTPVPLGRILGYFLRAVQLGLAVTAFALVFLALAVIPLSLGMAAAIDGSSAAASSLPELVGVVLGVVLSVVAFVVLARLSPVLPAVAIGKPLGLFGAWRATARSNRAILWSFILVCLAMRIASLPGAVIVMLAPPNLAAMLSTPFYVISSFVLVSYITSLYGVFVEKRYLG